MFTKTPDISTHQLKRLEATGNQTHTSNTRNWSALQGKRFINCFPHPYRMLGEDPQFVIRKAPSLITDSFAISIVPATTGRIDCFDNDTFLFCKDRYIYQLTSNRDIQLKATHPTLDTVFKSIQKVLDYSGAGNTIVCGVLQNSGGYFAWQYNLTTNILTTSPTAIVPAANGATIKSLFVDGYHIIGDTVTSRVFNSFPPGSYTSFDSTNYFVPEIEADDLVDIHKHKNTICSIGRRSIEFHYNNANALGSPFSRLENLTVKIGCNSQTKTIANADDIYFIGGESNSGISIMRIRDYKVESISDNYINYLLNNLADIGNPLAQNSATLGLLDIYGNVSLAISIQDVNKLYRTFVYNEISKSWWEWTQSDSTGLTGNIQLANNFGGRPVYINSTFIDQLYFNLNYIASGYITGFVNSSTDISIVNMSLTTTTLDVTYLTKNPLFVSNTAEFYTDIEDFDTNNYKHIKYVDAIGDYGANTVELAYTKNADYTNFSSLVLRNPSSLGMNNPIRWRNLCMTNKIAFRVRVIGASDMAHRGLDVSYNQHVK